MLKDCWGKGGSKEGQGPKGWKGSKNRSNHAQDTNSDLNKVSYMYMAYGTGEISKYNWLFDCGTTSHICTQQDAFIDYFPLYNSTIKGIGLMLATAMGKGTIKINMSVNGQMITHKLQDVLHVPDAPNCLLLAS